MIKKIGLFLLGIVIFFSGFGMIELGRTDPEMSADASSQVIAYVFGGCMIAGGAILSGIKGYEFYKKKKESGKNLIAKELRSDLFPEFYKITEDKTDTENLIRTFRHDYASFFEKPGVPENDAIQKVATQIYWHILSIKKQRLDQKGIHLGFTSERLGYGSIAPIRENKYFDGKYKINEISETVQAKEIFTREGKKLHTKKCVETAAYRVLSAEMKTKAQVVCPNCGSASTREDLIDGCDYCGTKFTIEDLENRVSEFGFRHDCDVEYAKYKSARRKLIPLFSVIVGVPTFLICLILCIKNSISNGDSIMIMIPAVMVASIVVTALIVTMALMFFIVFGIPLIQGIASLRFMSGRMIKKMEKQNKANKKVEDAIRRHDPLFSMNGFFSNLQNKLAVIHYARGPADASAFVESQAAEAQVSTYIGRYQDVIDMQVDTIQLQGYQVSEYLQEMSVAVRLTLLLEKNGKVKRKKETVRMILVKDKACKSQAVCAPSFTNCKQCGAPMSLLAGRVCNYCGHSRRLAEYDWAIRTYR